jgi:hypothetical protein
MPMTLTAVRDSETPGCSEIWTDTRVAEINGSWIVLRST